MTVDIYVTRVANLYVDVLFACVCQDLYVHECGKHSCSHLYVNIELFALVSTCITVRMYVAISVDIRCPPRYASTYVVRMELFNFVECAMHSQHEST